MRVYLGGVGGLILGGARWGLDMSNRFSNNHHIFLCSLSYMQIGKAQSVYEENIRQNLVKKSFRGRLLAI